MKRLWFWCGLLIAQCAAAAAANVPVEQKVQDTMAQRMQACMGCHGKEGRATPQGYFPRIAGKPASYLYNQLVSFRDGRRRNAAMAYLLAQMPDPYLQEIADYFAGLELPYAPPRTTKPDPATLRLGADLVLHGDPQRAIPACSQCHGQQMTGIQPAMPGLLGLSRDYLVAQLGAWRAGTRHAAAPDCMALIARRLSIEEIGAVATWLASQPVTHEVRAGSPITGAPPLKCGSGRP